MFRTMAPADPHGIRLTPTERLRIRARSGLAHETCRAIERGERTTDASRVRFERAAAEEGIDLAIRASDVNP